MAAKRNIRPDAGTAPSESVPASEAAAVAGADGPAEVDSAAPGAQAKQPPVEPAGAEAPNAGIDEAEPAREAGTGGEAGTEAERDPAELAAKAQKAQEYLELARRTKADFENYRKRAARDAAAAQERGAVKLAHELLPAIDNLDRALVAAESVPVGEGSGAEDGPATLVAGIKLVHAELIAALARAGIERFSPEGERFDPQLHEAMAQQPAEDAEAGTVIEVYQRGYRLGDSVIRPARVVVAG